jgi:hypothetical protein
MSPAADDERHRFPRPGRFSIYRSGMSGRAGRADWLPVAGPAVLAFSVQVPGVEPWRIGVLDHAGDRRLPTCHYICG